MELNITCRFMSIETRKMPDATLYAVSIFHDGDPITLYLAENNVWLDDLLELTFGDTITIKVSFEKHPKVSNAYKMKFRGLVE